MTLLSGNLKARLRNFACGGPLRDLPNLGLFLGFPVPQDKSHFFVNPLPVHTSHFEDINCEVVYDRQRSGGC